MISGPGGNASSFDNLDDVTLPDLDDDIEVVFVEDEEGATPPALRGQNEGADFDDDTAEPDYSSPGFQAKLNQEVTQARETAQAQALEQQERVEFALLRSEQSKIATQRDSFKLALDGVDVRIATTTEALKYAKQEGDTSSEVDLETKLRSLSQLRDKIDQNMNALPDERGLEAQFREHIEKRRSEYAGRQRASSEAPKALNDKAAKWTKVNSWMSDPSKAREKAALMEVNNALAAEGYDPNGDEFFTELSRRLAKRFPNLGVKITSGAQMGGQAPRQASQAPGQRQSAPVAPARSSAPPGPGTKSKTRVNLDSSDVALMKMFRIDMSDPVARARYAKEKHARVQSETRGR